MRRRAPALAPCFIAESPTTPRRVSRPELVFWAHALTRRSASHPFPNDGAGASNAQQITGEPSDPGSLRSDTPRSERSRHPDGVRPSDLARLREPYRDEESALDSADERVAARLRVSVPAARSLAETIYGDLDERVFGIGWWYPHVETRRSILIADHLYLATDALAPCLVEARLHQLELEDTWDEEDRRLQRHLSAGGDPTKFPPPVDATDELPFILENLHLAGVFRAVAHALDCLAAVVIAIGDLPVDMKRASWPAVLRSLTADNRPFPTALLALVHQSGPSAWIEWTLEMRNMMVHRPRVMSFGSIGFIGGDLHVRIPPQERVHITQLLPRTPTGSAAEGFAAAGTFGPTLLTEDGSITIERLVRSTTQLTESVAALAQDEWLRRRDAGEVQVRAARQWPAVGTQVHPFEGFAPGSAQLTPDVMMSSPRMIHRL